MKIILQPRDLHRLLKFAGRTISSCTMVVLICSSLFAQSVVARLQNVTGEVMIKHGDNWQKLTSGTADLFSGDKLVTGRGRAEIHYLDDGSTLTLDVGTNVTVSAPEPQPGGVLLRRIEIFLGNVWFDMKKNLSQRTDLVTPTAVGGLRGTQGLVHVEDESHSEFSLKEGELEISQRAANRGEQPVRLHAGQTLRAARGHKFSLRPLKVMPKKPDTSAPVNKLPKPNKNTMNRVRESERPPANIFHPAPQGKPQSKPERRGKTPPRKPAQPMRQHLSEEAEKS